MSTSLEAPPQERMRRPQSVRPNEPAKRTRRLAGRWPRSAAKTRLTGSRKIAARHAFRWVGGFLIASLLVTAVSPYFLSSLRVHERSVELDDYIVKPGYVHRNRDEGWSVTRYGSHGLHNAAGIESFSGSTVLIWGDSYVEAHQVNDEQKMDFQVNRALSQRRGGPIRAVAIGRAYWSIADYYFHIPRYEQLLNPACHFIVLAERGLKDLCPDGETFLAEPTYEFVARAVGDTRKGRIIADLQEYGLCDAALAPWKAVRTLLKNVRTSRFALGPAAPHAEHPVEAGSALFQAETPDRIAASWTYAIDKLASATGKPIVFVLVPEVPYLENGRVCFDDPQAKWRTTLVELLKEKGIGCIDMTETLIEDHRQTGRFSRGFHHGRPDRGHLNARGHWLLAQQISAYLDRHRDGR